MLSWRLSPSPQKGGPQTFFTPIFFIASCTAVFPAALFLQKSQALALLAAHWACKSSVGFIERTGPTAVLFRGHLTVKMYVIHNCVAKKEIPCASIHVFSPLSHKSRTAINAVCLYTWVWAWIAHYLISKAVLFCIWETRGDFGTLLQNGIKARPLYTDQRHSEKNNKKKTYHLNFVFWSESSSYWKGQWKVLWN